MNQRVSQLDRTKATIMDAAAEIVFGSQNVEAITMQAIADAAGVSHRTLYRHFPSRTDLINEVGRRYDNQIGVASGVENATRFDEWVAGIEQTVGFGATNLEMLRRTLGFAIASGEFRTDRDEMYWRLFREHFRHLDEAEARQDFIAIRHLLGASNVILIGERFGLSPDELVAVIGRSVDILLRDAEQRDRRAAEIVS